MTKESLTSLFDRPFTDAKDNWKAKCPFHGGGNERTPSFYVHKDENIAHCFGCSISGHISKLGAFYTGKTQDEVCELLGITLEDEVRKRIGRTRGNAEPYRPKTYPTSWLAPWKKEVHEYVLERGFSLRTLQRAGARYDQSKCRQVFPWYSREGNLVGATGRDCRGTSPAKWYHYWDFDRGQHLYTLPGRLVHDLSTIKEEPSLPTPVQERPLLLVEGIFDLLWVYQETGYESMAAPIAATLTGVQSQKVRALSREIILGFDNDEAGLRGSLRSYYRLRASAEVRFIDWPTDAKDWMDLDGEHCRKAIQETLSYLQWAKRLRDKGHGDLLKATADAHRKEQEVRQRRT